MRSSLNPIDVGDNKEALPPLSSLQFLSLLLSYAAIEAVVPTPPSLQRCRHFFAYAAKVAIASKIDDGECSCNGGGFARRTEAHKPTLDAAGLGDFFGGGFFCAWTTEGTSIHSHFRLPRTGRRMQNGIGTHARSIKRRLLHTKAST